MEPYKVDFESLAWDDSVCGVRSKSCERGGGRLRLAEFTEAFSEPEGCTRGHVGYILEGRMEIAFEGGVVVFGPGDGVVIPAGEAHRHRGRVLTDVVRVILLEEA